jgi:hypothetical protein
MEKSFITGSRIYGIPKPDSDIDLVVFLTHDEYWKLAKLASPSSPSNHPSASDEDAHPSLYFGNLNLIPAFEPEVFQAWFDGTEFLKQESPVPKQRACEVMEEFRMRGREAANKRKGM